MHDRHRDDDTHNVIRLAANIFVVMTSLVLGLMLNSAKNTFEAVDRNVHVFATDLVLLDRSLRNYGLEATDVRKQLASYVEQVVAGTWPVQGTSVLDDRAAERLLDGVRAALLAIRPNEPVRFELWREAHNNLQNVVKGRWILIEQSEGTIPTALLVVVVAWLMLIFGSFGYRAPRNVVVLATFVVAAFLLSAAVYLVLDMGSPFSGPIQISPEPLMRVKEQLRG
ncbi:MAG TPA: hypothetical protein VE421_02910 [Burkholderiaceae bacterium]|nr:hypothetical protein [Burkholderiaceae bacterium]